MGAENQACSLMLRGVRQRNYEFEVSLGYSETLSRKQWQQQNEIHIGMTRLRKGQEITTSRVLLHACNSSKKKKNLKRGKCSLLGGTNAKVLK